jgi:hypothetical protein
MGEMRNACSILVGKPEGKRPLGRHRLGWEGNVRMDIGDIGWEGVNWIHLAQDGPVAGPCEHGNEPSGSVEVREFLDGLNDC